MVHRMHCPWGQAVMSFWHLYTGVFLLYFSHPLKFSLSHLLLYQHCGKMKSLYASTCVAGVTQSVQMAFARFSSTAYNGGTCDKVWNASFKFDHISKLADTFPSAGGLLNRCLWHYLLFRDYHLQDLFWIVFFFFWVMLDQHISTKAEKKTWSCMWHIVLCAFISSAPLLASVFIWLFKEVPIDIWLYDIHNYMLEVCPHSGILHSPSQTLWTQLNHAENSLMLLSLVIYWTFPHREATGGSTCLALRVLLKIDRSTWHFMSGLASPSHLCSLAEGCRWLIISLCASH